MESDYREAVHTAIRDLNLPFRRLEYRDELDTHGLRVDGYAYPMRLVFRLPPARST